MLLDAFRLIENGHARAVPQQHTRATFARRLTKDDGLIDWNMPAGRIHNRIRGFQPWPGSYFPMPGLSSGDMIKVQSSRVVSAAGTPGCLLEVSGEGPLVATGEGSLRLLVLQPPGGKPMMGSDFLRGHRWLVGETLPGRNSI